MKCAKKPSTIHSDNPKMNTAPMPKRDMSEPMGYFAMGGFIDPMEMLQQRSEREKLTQKAADVQARTDYEAEKERKRKERDS